MRLANRFEILRHGWVAVFVFAAALRLAMVGLELHGRPVAAIVPTNWDSREYVHLGHNLATTGRYAADTIVDPVDRRLSHFFALLRTPGYPMLLAASERLTGSIAAVLWGQAIAGASLAAVTASLGRRVFDDGRVGLAAGLLSAVSSTGIGGCGLVLTDVPFALCVALAWALLAAGVSTGRVGAFAAAGFTMSVGVLVKPTLLYFPLLVPIVAWLLARGVDRAVPWRGVAVACLLPLATAAAWCWHNVRTEGGWVYCIVDGQNLHHFLQPTIEQRYRAGGPPTFSAVMAAQNAARDRDWSDLVEGRLTPVALGRRQRAEAMAAVRHHPWLAVQSVCGTAWDNWGTGWPYTADQLSTAPRARSALFWLDDAWHGYGRPVGLTLAIVGLLDPFAVGDPGRRRRRYGAVALLVTAGYFLALCGTSFSVGFRTLYPGEFALLLLAANGAGALGLARSRRIAATGKLKPAAMPLAAHQHSSEDVRR